MWPVTPAWLAALTASHGRYTRMEVWFNRVRVAASVPVESGAVQVTARNRVRRSLDAVVPESYWPSTATSALAPYGARLKVFQGVTGANGQLIGAEVPVFAGRVETVDRERSSGKVRLTGLDPFADVNDMQFESPRTPDVGGNAVNAIISLIGEALPGTVFVNQMGPVYTLPSGIMWDTDRGAAIDQLAASIGAEVFFQPDGTTCVIRPVPTLTGTPVWTLRDGTNGTILRDSQSKSRTDVVNRVVVHVEQPGAGTVLVMVSDDAPSSATRYGGPFGKSVRHVNNPLITNVTFAYTAGYARLARFIGAARTRQIQCVSNPALEAGDLLQVATTEGTEAHIADSFPVPLEVETPMTIDTRSTGTSVS